MAFSRTGWFFPQRLALLACLVLAAAAAEVPAPFTDKAVSLTAGATTRIQRITAIHAFARDQIRQIATEFG